MVSEQTHRSKRSITADEQKLYDHLLYWVEWESPSELIERFRALFIDGVGYPDPEIVQALNQVTASDLALEEFRYVLNRCCHILINRWQARPQHQLAIPQLIRLFNTSPTTRTVSAAHSRSVRRLRQLIQHFTTSEQYLTLRRLAQVLTEAAEEASQGSRPLGTLIRRYPYLYEHCLLSDGSTQEQQHTVRHLQASMQRQFEINLSHYVTHQVRRSQTLVYGNGSPSALIRPVTNPTLLSEQELGQALRYYIGKVDGSRSHKDLAHSFLTHITPASSFKTFKDDLYQYLTASVDSGYGRRMFNNQLYASLQNTFPESDAQRLNDFLVVRTCTNLLNFLVADRSHHPNHFVFIDLTTNLGPVLTTGLLLKLVLVCRKIRPSLERRFSMLFNHYEASAHDAVVWLIQALENLNVALATNFGSVVLLGK